MITEITMPKMRRFTYPDGSAFYLSKTPVEENGNPKVYVSRWDADHVLREIEGSGDLEDGSFQFPTLYESHAAAEQDSEIHDSIFSLPAEWQSHLILNPNAPTETIVYVLKDANRNEAIIKKSKTPRNVIPARRYKDGDKEVVIANVFDIPFELKNENGSYNPEDLDPESGFLTKLDPDGKYGIWFGSDDRLYAAVLIWSGHVYCDWVPGHSNDYVGFRGRSTGNVPPQLLEPEIDVLNSKLERTEKEHSRKENSIREKLEKLEEHYKSGFEQLHILMERLERK